MRIAHVSDLHFGRHDEVLAGNFAAEIAAHAPDLIVASGDFTQHGTEDEFKAAHAFLDTLSAPVFAVPGNHDVPALDLIGRFFNPYGRYRRYIADDLEPFLERDGVAIAGLKTARRMRLRLDWARGSISVRQLRQLEHRFEGGHPGSIRIVVAHHPLLQPDSPMDVPMHPVDRADQALDTFAKIGVRLVMSGHFHLAYVRRHEQAGAVKVGIPPGLREAAKAPILVVQASSAISTRLRGQPNAYNLVDIDGEAITVTVRESREGRWADQEQASVAAQPV